MAVATRTVGAKVEIGGAELEPDLAGLIDQVIVEDHLHRADMVVIAFRDVELDVIERAGIEVGKKIAVSAAAVGEVANEAIFKGEITSIEADYDALGSRAIVRGYDLSHRLAGGRLTETYANVTDADIAKTIAGRNDLRPGTIDETRETFEHVSQVNQTDQEFLKARARRIGFEVLVVDDQLHFRKPIESSTAPGPGSYENATPEQLIYRHNLLEFRARITAVNQPATVKVRGWDPLKKEAIVSEAEPTANHVNVPSKPTDLASAVGGGELVATDRVPATQGVADAAAQALGAAAGEAAFHASGVAIGSPALRAGTAVNISGVGSTFNGRYVLTTVQHKFGDVAYRSTFEVTGAQDRSLHNLVAGDAPIAGRIYGVVVAIVTNNEDPEKLGRVKLKFPWLADSFESDWARMTSLGAGPDSGAVWIPEVNDEVLVAFELGHPSRPYVVGSLWNGVDKPPLGDGLMDNGPIVRRGFVSRKGHKFVFFDKDGKSGIAILSSDNKLKIALKETDGEIHIASEGKIVIESKQDLKITSQANLELNGQSGLKIKTSGQLEISGSKIALN